MVLKRRINTRCMLCAKFRDALCTKCSVQECVVYREGYIQSAGLFTGCPHLTPIPPWLWPLHHSRPSTTSACISLHSPQLPPPKSFLASYLPGCPSYLQQCRRLRLSLSLVVRSLVSICVPRYRWRSQCSSSRDAPSHTAHVSASPLSSP